jgi:hypothetical protein
MQRLTMRNRSDKFKYKIAQYREDIPTPKRGEIIIIPEDNRLTEIPPYLSSSQLPSWWKDLPKGKGSLRFCEGTYDLNHLGFVMPLWSNVKVRPNIQGNDFEVRIDPIADFAGEDSNFRIQDFPAASTVGCPMEDIRKIKTGRYIKLVSPWRYKTPKGISLMAIPLLHEPNPNYDIVPGLIHTDYYSQIHIVLNIKTDKEFIIKAGTPMQQLIPINRNDNTKKIIFGNESMFKYLKHSGLNDSYAPSESTRVYYRKKQRELDQEALERDSKKWYSLKK